MFGSSTGLSRCYDLSSVRDRKAREVRSKARLNPDGLIADAKVRGALDDFPNLIPKYSEKSTDVDG
jgi:hypothetical protein